MHRAATTAQWNWTQRVVSGRRGQPAVGLVRQLRHRRHAPTASASSARPTSRAGPSTLHEKAIYIVEGQLFQVERLDFDGRKAYVRAGRLRLLHRRDHVHEGDDSRHVRIGRPGRGLGSRRSDRSARHPQPIRDRAIRSHGEVHVVSRVVGFKKIKFYTNENVGSGELDLPEQQMHTTVVLADDPGGRDGDAAVRAATIGATASSGWRSRCGTSRSCC